MAEASQDYEALNRAHNPDAIGTGHYADPIDGKLRPIPVAEVAVTREDIESEIEAVLEKIAELDIARLTLAQRYEALERKLRAAT